MTVASESWRFARRRGRGSASSSSFELFASGATRADVLKSYPHLAAEGVEEALRYAGDVLKHDRMIPLARQRA